MSIYAWHFTGDRLRDGRPLPAVGEWLEHEGLVRICESGLHASRRPADALWYAPGPMLHLVECAEIASEQADKLVCRRRRIIASMDATDMLRYYARMRALSAIHLWDAPDVVLDYLMTGDKRLGIAASDAARDASTGARSAAARVAASAAARAVTWATARDAAWDSVRAVAWTASRDATLDAAWGEFDELVYECFEGPMQDINWGGEAEGDE